MPARPRASCEQGGKFLPDATGKFRPTDPIVPL